MLMVIFGAGASYDSSPRYRPPTGQGNQVIPSRPSPPNRDEYWRPPLATQLFPDPHGVYGDIVRKYRKLLPIIGSLQSPSKGRSVEEELEFLQEEALEDPDRKRQLFSVRYYLHDLLLTVTNKWLDQTKDVTNYVRLIDQIRHANEEKEPVCLVTFNYDLLLDRALESYDYKPQPIENQFDAHPEFKLFKPHGCVSWARFVNVPRGTRMQPFGLIEEADRISLSNEFVVANATHQHQIFNFDRPIVPAIAVPVQSKTEDTFEWPKRHRVYLESLLPSVTKILIIGWQAREAHFMQMLRDGLPSGGRELAHVMTVGKNEHDSFQTLRNFEAGLSQPISNHTQAPWGFSQLVANGEVEPFLKS